MCIVGAGPAGLMAAIGAATEGVHTVLIEANSDAGRKLLVTGGGRCNFTHAASVDELVRAFGKGGRFLRHSFHEVRPEDIVEFFRTRGIESIVEPDGSVFPASHDAADIRDVLLHEDTSLGVHLLRGGKVTEVTSVGMGFLVHVASQIVHSRQLIIATGGVSWPQTGSTGDGYRFAAALGHTVTPPRAALVPLVTAESWAGTLAGVSIPRVRIEVTTDSRRTIVCGSMLFTQDGIGGPAALDLSRHLTDRLPQRSGGEAIRIDLAPDMDQNALDRHLQEQLAAHVKKSILNILADFVPRRLASVLCDLAPCNAELQTSQLKKETGRRLGALLKNLPLHVTDTRPIAEAVVTRGGVSTDQIDPRTMESRIHPGLFFAGEVIDVDGPCGGYNLHACWATGTLAGRSAGRRR